MQFLKEENARLQSERLALRTTPPFSIIAKSSADPSQRQHPVVISVRPVSPVRMDIEGPDSPGIPDSDWEFNKELFQELTVNVKEIYTYKSTTQKLAHRLWPNGLNRYEKTLSGPKLKVACEAEWEQWELDNPEITHAVIEDKLRSREMLENQPKWRLEFLRKHANALEIYRRLPQELRIDPTFCPCDQHYTWEKFKKIQT